MSRSYRADYWGAIGRFRKSHRKSRAEARRLKEPEPEPAVPQGRDNCQTCDGKSGGVKGNENVLELRGLRVVMCDFCTAAKMGNSRPECKAAWDSGDLDEFKRLVKGETDAE